MFITTRIRIEVVKARSPRSGLYITNPMSRGNIPKHSIPFTLFWKKDVIFVLSSEVRNEYTV